MWWWIGNKDNYLQGVVSPCSMHQLAPQFVLRVHPHHRKQWDYLDSLHCRDFIRESKCFCYIWRILGRIITEGDQSKFNQFLLDVCKSGDLVAYPADSFPCGIDGQIPARIKCPWITTINTWPECSWGSSHRSVPKYEQQPHQTHLVLSPCHWSAWKN